MAKRVLIITYYWPPSGGSGVQRWVKFAKFLPSEGWQPVIYTPENPELTAIDETLGAEIPPEVEILKRQILEPYGLYRKLMGKGASTDIKAVIEASGTPSAGISSLGTDGSSSSVTAAASGGEVTPIRSGAKNWKQRLSLWIRGNLFVPDPRVGWVRPSVRFLKKYLKEHPVDVIVTTGPPHSMHLIGRRLARATGLPWVSDFRDPWTKMYYLKHLGLSKRTWRRLERMEQRVLDESSTVLAVTPLVQEDIQARTRTPVAMITNGYDREDFEGPAPEPDGFFNIVHTGLFASDGNPLALWKVLDEMVSDDPEFAARLRLRLVGKVDREVLEALAAAGLKENTVSLGYLDHAAAVREQRGASLLILPLRNDPEYRPILPGKLFEYLAARRPILGIGQEDGAMARVLMDTGAGITADWNNEAAIRSFLATTWNVFRATAGPAPVIPGLIGNPAAPGEPSGAGDIGRFERRALTAALARLLDSLC